ETAPLPNTAIKSESSPQFSTLAPMAVQKIAPVHFPMKYQLTQEDVIFPDKKFDGLVNIVARIDKDGNTKLTPGDFEGFYTNNPAKVGEKRVNILINKQHPKD